MVFYSPKMPDAVLLMALSRRVFGAPKPPQEEEQENAFTRDDERPGFGFANFW